MPLPISIVLAGSEGHSKPFTYDGSDSSIPPGFEWARDSLRNLGPAMEKVESGYAKLNPSYPLASSLAETFAREKAVIVIAQDETARKLSHTSGTREFYAGGINFKPEGSRQSVPALLINDMALSHSGIWKRMDDHSFLLGYGLGKFFDVPLKRPDGKSNPDFSDTALYRIAYSLEAINTIVNGYPHHTQSLYGFLDHALNLNPPQSDGNLNYKQEIFASIAGELMSPPSPLKGVPEEKDLPIHVPPLLEEYVRGPFAMDMQFRSVPNPGNLDRQKQNKFREKLFSPMANLSLTSYREIYSFIEEANSFLEADNINAIDKDKLKRMMKDTHEAIRQLGTQSPNVPGL